MDRRVLFGQDERSRDQLWWIRGLFPGGAVPGEGREGGALWLGGKHGGEGPGRGAVQGPERGRSGRAPLPNVAGQGEVHAEDGVPQAPQGNAVLLRPGLHRCEHPIKLYCCT